MFFELRARTLSNRSPERIRLVGNNMFVLTYGEIITKINDSRTFLMDSLTSPPHQPTQKIITSHARFDYETKIFLRAVYHHGSSSLL